MFVVEVVDDEANILLKCGRSPDLWFTGVTALALEQD